MENKLITLNNLEEFNTAIDEKIANSQTDMSNYYTKTEVDTAVNAKQSKLSVNGNLYYEHNGSSKIQAAPFRRVATNSSIKHEAIRWSNAQRRVGADGVFAILYNKNIYYINSNKDAAFDTGFSNIKISSKYNGDYDYFCYGNGIFLIKTNFSDVNYGFFYAHSVTGDYVRIGYNASSGSTYNYIAVPENLKEKTFNNMVFVKDRFILYHTDGSVAFWSKDGLEWTEIVLPVEGAIKKFIATDSHICVVQGTNVSFTKDFETYETVVSSVDFSTYSDVEYFKGAFYAAYGSSFTLSRSEDLQKWRGLSPGFSRTVKQLFKTRDALFIGFSDYTSSFFYSIDGYSIIECALPDSHNQMNFVDVGNYVALCGENVLSTGKMTRISVLPTTSLGANDIKCVDGETVQYKIANIEEELSNLGNLTPGMDEEDLKAALDSRYLFFLPNTSFNDWGSEENITFVKERVEHLAKEYGWNNMAFIMAGPHRTANGIFVFKDNPSDNIYRYEKLGAACDYVKHNDSYDSIIDDGHYLKIEINVDTLELVNIGGEYDSGLQRGSFLGTSYDYPTPYTPKYAGSPATKQYVDDTVAGASSSPTCVEFLPNLYYHYNGNMIEASTGCTFTTQKGIATLTKCKKADGTYITKVDCSISLEGSLDTLIGNKYLIDTWFSIGELPYYNTSTGTKIYDVKLAGLTKTTSPSLQLFDGGDYSKYLYFCYVDGTNFTNYYADELTTGEFKLSCDITYYTTDIEA